MIFIIDALSKRWSGPFSFVAGFCLVLLAAIPFTFWRKDVAVSMIFLGLILLILGYLLMKRSIQMDESDGDLSEPEQY